MAARGVLAARVLSAEVGIIHLDLSLQQISFLPLSHRSARLLQSRLALLLGAVEPLELRQGKDLSETGDDCAP